MMVFLVDMNYHNTGEQTGEGRGGWGHTRGIFLESAILNDECAKPVMDCMKVRATFCTMTFATHLVCVVHTHSNSPSLEIIHIQYCRRFAISRSIYKLQLARSWSNEIRRPVLHRTAQCQLTVLSGYNENVPGHQMHDVQ